MDDLGRALKNTRKVAGLTLDVAAKRADVTKGYLSKVESGKAMPSIAVLSRLADGYGISLSDIFMPDGQRQPLSLVRANGRTSINRNGSELGYSYELASLRKLNPRAEVYFLSLPVLNDGTEPPRFRHSGEEIILMLDGHMRFEYGGAEFEMGPGDCIHFEANIEHHGVASRGRPAAAFVVVIPDHEKPDRS